VFNASLFSLQGQRWLRCKVGCIIFYVYYFSEAAKTFSRYRWRALSCVVSWRSESIHREGCWLRVSSIWVASYILCLMYTRDGETRGFSPAICDSLLSLASCIILLRQHSIHSMSPPTNRKNTKNGSTFLLHDLFCSSV